MHRCSKHSKLYPQVGLTWKAYINYKLFTSLKLKKLCLVQELFDFLPVFYRTNDFAVSKKFFVTLRFSIHDDFFMSLYLKNTVLSESEILVRSIFLFRHNLVQFLINPHSPVSSSTLWFVFILFSVIVPLNMLLKVVPNQKHIGKIGFFLKSLKWLKKPKRSLEAWLQEKYLTLTKDKTFLAKAFESKTFW